MVERTLITGGTGLIGAHVARLLVEHGERPVLLELAPRQEALAGLAQQVELVQGDVLNLEQVAAALRQHGITRIIHTAAMRGLTKVVQEQPYDGARLNFDGTLNMLEAARREGVRRVVMSSSASIYYGSLRDAAGDILPALPEEMPLQPPPSIYAATKLAAEHLGRNYARWFGVEFTAVRYARVFGPQAKPITPQGQTMKKLVEAVLGGETAESEADRLTGDLLYYKDAARGTVLAALKDGPPAPAYNIATGVYYEFDQFIATLQRLVPGAKVKRLPLPPDHPYNFKIPLQDCRLAQHDLGFTAEYDLERLLAEYCDYLKASPK